MDFVDLNSSSSVTLHITGGQTNMVAACVCAVFITTMNPLICITLWQVKDWKFAEYTMFQLALSDLSRCCALVWIAAVSCWTDYETRKWHYQLGGIVVFVPFAMTLVQVSSLSINKMVLVSSKLSLQAERSSWRLKGICYNLGIWIAMVTLATLVAFLGDVRCIFLPSVHFSVYVISSQQITLFWIVGAAVFLLPVVVLTVSYVVILHVARTKAVAAIRSAGRQSQRPRRAMLTIGATIGVFYLSNLPSVVVSVFIELGQGVQPSESIAVCFAFYLMQTGGFANFLLYYMTDRKFRNAAGKVWLARFAKRIADIRTGEATANGWISRQKRG